MSSLKNNWRLVLVVWIFCAFTKMGKAQNPGWTVNSASYANSMNVIGFLWVDGVESTDTNDIVAAFIDGEVRGVTKPTFVSEINRYVVFLSVYSNQATGTVSFKIYDASSDSVYDIVKTVGFTPDALIGGLNESFVWSNQNLKTEAIITSFSLPSAYGDVVIDGLNIKINASLDLNENLNNQIATFQISDKAKVTVGGTAQVSGQTANDFSQVVTYRVQSEDLLTVNEYLVTVTKINRAPSDLQLDNNTIDENQSANLFVGSFSTVDEDSGESHQYAFVSGGADNDLFALSGNALIAKSSHNYESSATRTVKVKSTDKYGKTITKDFTINISNINDAPTAMSLTANSIAENSSANSTVAQFSTTDEDAGETFTYSLVSGAGDADNGFFEIQGASLVAKASFNHEEKEVREIRVQVTDSKGATFADGLDITIQDVNEQPIVTGTINPITISVNAEETVQFPANLMEDPDDGDNVTYSAEMSDGSSLPAWINFNASERTFNLNPLVNDIGDYTIKIVGTDGSGLKAETNLSLSVTLVAEIDQDNISDLVTVYPNPVSEKIYINASVFRSIYVDLKLISLGSGEQLINMNIQPKDGIELNVAQFPEGIYLLEVKNDFKVARKKVLIVR